MRTHRERSLLLAVVLSAAGSLSAFAQETAATDPTSTAAPETEATTSDSAADATIEEIVVTAQKREEEIQDVPISVVALQASQLEKLHLTTITDLTSAVPGLVVQTPITDATPSFAIRGVTAFDFAVNNASPVGVHIDEVYRGVPVLQSLQMYDLDRIEVLRGPQGTLFGRNTTGGTVNFHTKQPALDGFDGYIAGGLGNYDRREVSGALESSAVDDTIGARAAFNYARTDGFVRNLNPGFPDFSDINQWAFRLSGRWRPSDALDSRLTYTRSRSDPKAHGGRSNDFRATDPVETNFGYIIAGRDWYYVDSDLPDGGSGEVKNQSVALRLEWDASDKIAVTSVTSWDEGFLNATEDSDASPYNMQHNTVLGDVTAVAQDVRVASASDSSFQWTAGFYFFFEEIDGSTLIRFWHELAGDADGNGQLDCLDDFTTGCNYRNRFGQTRTAYAPYVDVSWKPVEDLTLLGGLRYTHDRIEIDYYEAFIAYLDPALSQAFDFFQTISGAPDPLTVDGLWTGRVGLQYQVADEVMAYFTYSRGARSASYNGFALSSPTEVTIADPETIDSYEVGLKSEWLNSRLRANAAVFYYDWRNQQVNDIILNTLFVLVNADKVRNAGGELELLAVPSDRLRLELAVTFLDAEYKDFVLRGQQLAGNTAISSPKWTVNMGANWRIIETSIGNLSARFETRFTDRQYYDPTQTKGVGQAPYWVHNARLSFATLGDRLTFSAWVQNIGAEKIKLFEFRGTYRDGALIGRPRTFGFDAKYEF